MSRKKKTSEMGEASAEKEKHFAGRRNFLKGSVVGIGALALADLNSVAAEATSAQSGDSNGSQTQTQTATVPAPPDQCEENWFEPWEWHTWEHPDEYLQLHVTQHVNPRMVTGEPPATLSADEKKLWPAFLFGYNGLIPGPTIRTRGDSVCRVHLVNHLTGNDGTYAFNNGARFVDDSYVPTGPNTPPQQFMANAIVPQAADWLLSEAMLFGNHQQHTTNIHTHGLHVTPRQNADGTESDNVLLRIIPRDDYRNRMNNNPSLPLTENEIVGEAKYHFKLGKSAGPNVEIHPPGTFWYHPHPHGATYDQVASGMAGFLIIEGDVDEALRQQIKGYRERLMLVQRVIGPPPAQGETPQQKAQNAGKKKTRAGSHNKPAFNSVNGQPAGKLKLNVRPGAIERWRIINGSVDGQGFTEMMVVEGEPPPQPAPYNLPANPTTADYQQLLAYYGELSKWNQTNLESKQVPNELLAFDGITLVSAAGQYQTVMMKSTVMGPANRVDFLFQAPPLKAGQTSATYTLWGKWVAGATDRFVPPTPAGSATGLGPVNIKIATICVTGDPMDAGVTRNPQTGTLNLKFPPVPNYLKPVPDSEVTIQSTAGQPMWRTRRILYSGWGDASYPCQGTDTCAPNHPCNAMGIDGRKYDDETIAHKMGLGTAEEWTLNNSVLTMYQAKANGPTIYGKTVSHEVLIQAFIDGGNVFSKAADHPFHIHQNPFWVTAIIGSDGQPLNWNYQPLKKGETFMPRWQDVIRIPRNGGRIVFRARFWDFNGEYVNHCHLLNHEDWGMMETLSVVVNPFDADYKPKPVGYKYPQMSVKEMYSENVKFLTPFQPNEPRHENEYCTPPNPPPPA